MGIMNVGGAIHSPMQAALSDSLKTNVPEEMTVISPLKRSHRVNIRLREDEVSTLEHLALAANMPFQAFLSDLIHKYATGEFQERQDSVRIYHY